LAGRHCTLRTRLAANPVHQRCQAGAVLVRYPDEFQAQPVAGNHVLDDCIGSDLPFRNKKINLGFCGHGPWHCCAEEQPADAQIANAGNIIPALASPVNPHIISSFDSRDESSRIERSGTSGGHKSRWALRNKARSCGDGARDSRPVVDHNGLIESRQSGKYLKWAAGITWSKPGTGRSQLFAAADNEVRLLCVVSWERHCGHSRWSRS
jgi:hypothetical protein